MGVSDDILDVDLLAFERGIVYWKSLKKVARRILREFRTTQNQEKNLVEEDRGRRLNSCSSLAKRNIFRELKLILASLIACLEVAWCKVRWC